MGERVWYYLGRDEGGKTRDLEDFDSLDSAINWAANWASVEESEIDYEQVLKALDTHGVWRLGDIWIKEGESDEEDG
jgi:hypothetical protein